MKNLIVNLDLSVGGFIDFENSGWRVDIFNIVSIWLNNFTPTKVLSS